MAQAGGTFSIAGTTATLYNSYNHVIALCKLENDLYILGDSITNDSKIQGPIRDNNISIKDEQALSSVSTNMVSQWHKRLGHVSFPRLQDLVNHNLVTGINIQHVQNIHPFCESCIIGKQHKNPFPKLSDSRATNLLDLIHTD